MKKIILIIFILLFFCGIAFPANHYIRDGGTGDGSDWTNAFSDLPDSFIRDDIYYVADGTYTGHTFNTSASGTTTITIKKATASDHGTETGWDSAYGDGQAVFGKLTFSTGYWIFDGVTGGGPSSWTSGFGFKVTASNATYDQFITLGASGSNIIITHVDIGMDSQPNPGCDCAIYSAAGADNITLSYSYVHHFGDVGFTILNSSGWVFEYNRFDRLDRYGEKDGICGTLGQLNHGTGIELYDTEGFTLRYNSISNIEGTGWIGYYGDNVLNNVIIYGNLFYNTSDFSGTWGNGMIYNTSGAGDVTNLKIYNNTFADLNYAMILGITHDISGNEFKNNIVYNVDGTPGYTGCTRDYNASDEAISGDSHLENLASNPFVDSANYDYHLVSSNAVDNGLDFGSPYDSDMDGVLRPQGVGVDIGAFEFLSGLNNAGTTVVISTTGMTIIISASGATVIIR